jgi:DNA (cytosine-5)-methyltransferase 1
MNYFSMFSGIGGFEKGIEDATRQTSTRNQPNYHSNSEEFECSSKRDFSCIGFSEIDRYATAIYKYHYNHKNFGDCRAIDPNGLPDFDLIIGGFPCQSFSIAGKRGGFSDTRGTLFFEIARIARVKRPGYLFLENVKGLLSHDEGNTFATIISTLDELGYDCQWQVLNSKNHGVPQNRERVFIIGNLRGQPRPKVFPIGEADELYPESDRQITHAIDSNYGKGWLDNQQRTMVRTRSNQQYKESGVETPLRQSDKAEVRIIGGLQAHQTPRQDGICPTLNQAMGQGGGQTPLVMNTLTEATGNRAGSSKEFLKTVDTIHKTTGNIRRLTPIECERLQGFPDNWTKYGLFGDEVKEISDTQRYKMCGNAVTTNVIRDIVEKWIET